ncbi:Rieske 2Fe-2S domain-containing protein [Dietzia sp. ANT_WB102]|nr:Rieske 2Fe-2S domain-containing protein [Dietzia sp. ANT_WB102]
MRFSSEGRGNRPHGRVLVAPEPRPRRSQTVHSRARVARLFRMARWQLTYALGTGVDVTTFEDKITDWTDAMAEADLTAEAPAVARLEGNDVLLVWHDGRIHAITDRCTHRRPTTRGRVRRRLRTVSLARQPIPARRRLDRPRPGVPPAGHLHRSGRRRAGAGQEQDLGLAPARRRGGTPNTNRGQSA